MSITEDPAPVVLEDPQADVRSAERHPAWLSLKAAATALQEPPEEPPGTWSGFQGFLVGP